MAFAAVSEIEKPFTPGGFASDMDSDTYAESSCALMRVVLFPDSGGVALVCRGEVLQSTLPEIVWLCPSTITVVLVATGVELGAEAGSPFFVEQAAAIVPTNKSAAAPRTRAQRG